MCLLIAVFYVVTLFLPERLIDVIGNVGLTTTVADVKFWIVAVPVFVAFVVVLFISEWFGWTMATTPAPRPIKEVTNEISQETPKENKSE